LIIQHGMPASSTLRGSSVDGLIASSCMRAGS
jgi:hypothetical protein